MQNVHLYGYDVGVDYWGQMGATSVQADKVVNVRISESEHTLLKAYCASLNRSNQDVLRDFALMQKTCIEIEGDLSSKRRADIFMGKSINFAIMQKPV